MGRTVRGGNRDHTPNVRSVLKVELSEKNTEQRFIAVIILLIIAAAAFSYAFHGLMSNDSGWTNIEASSSAELNCGDDFIFQYYIGAAGVNATAEKKALTLLYTDAVVKAYEMFNNDGSFDGMTNLYDINQHPNEELTVDEALYHALEQIGESGRRELYLAPIYADYDNLFFCNDDAMTVDFDAWTNEELASYYTQMLTYTNDPAAVSVELLGDNKVMLRVSDDYLAFAKENYISSYIDFYWMKNAFIVDYLAEVIAENGYTLGSITSYDGFTRNLDDGSVSAGTEDGAERTYSFNIYDRQGNTIYPAGLLTYSGQQSIVFLRNYPMSDRDDYNYYEFQNGEIRTSYVSASDGLCRSSVNNIVAYSDTLGCAEILLELIPVYIADEVDADLLKDMQADGIESIYGENGVLYYTEDGVKLSELYENDNVAYKSELIK